jgi:hypothetical protein
MTASRASIKAEVNQAVVKGIRRRGHEAVETFLVGMSKLLLAAVALGIVLVATAIAGLEPTALHLVLATAALTTAVDRLVTGRPRR